MVFAKNPVTTNEYTLLRSFYRHQLLFIHQGYYLYMSMMLMQTLPKMLGMVISLPKSTYAHIFLAFMIGHNLIFVLFCLIVRMLLSSDKNTTLFAVMPSLSCMGSHWQLKFGVLLLVK